MGLSAQEIARRSADAMWARDDASKWFGVSLDEVGPGGATTSLKVLPHHTNGHDICHGGVIFALADTAFAFACNSYNRLAVAQHNVITYVSPGKLGEVLTAKAREISRSGRSGVYDVSVKGEDGRTIAEFRGASRDIDGQHFDAGEA